MTACVQSTAMFGSELWWKGDHVPGTIGWADELQLLVYQEARARTGCIRTTNSGTLAMESGLRAAVIWRDGISWAGIKTHMGYSQEAYDSECAALARALESASRRNMAAERITIFTDAQAAIRRLASDEPGPGQQYALQARMRVGVFRRARPGITIKIRWCPAHKGIAHNGKADEWAKIAAEEPDTKGWNG